jgi:hypothetical protein
MDELRRPDHACRQVEATPGLVVTHLSSQFTGAVVSSDDGGVVLRCPRPVQERHFALHTGSFLLRGEKVTLVRPQGPRLSPRATRTASGSIAVKGGRARVARAGRLLVEGVHDAELVEKVWGDDLRLDGIVVERLDGLDHLAEVIDAFAPAADARLGVLVDHLVPASKEWRLVAQAARPHVEIRGTPYVDIWQAVRPSAVGITAWPVVPPGRPWKEGICEAFGESSPGRLWKRLLASVRSYADLEPALVGAVESLIDFVSETG